MAEEFCDLDSVAGVLKLYFRGMENPLFPKDSYDQLMECGRKGNVCLSYKCENLYFQAIFRHRNLYILYRYILNNEIIHTELVKKKQSMYENYICNSYLDLY